MRNENKEKEQEKSKGYVKRKKEIHSKNISRNESDSKRRETERGENRDIQRIHTTVQEGEKPTRNNSRPIKLQDK